jgi:capsular polysaccharide biosynthesis protein
MQPPNSIDLPPAPERLPAIDGSRPADDRVFEMPNSLVLSAIADNKRIVALFAVVLALIGAGLGLLRDTTYTASATLQVGQVNPNSPGFLGYVQSASSLATAFSRSIAAAPVLATVERKLALEAADVTPRLSAEPIPLAPAFRVIATGSSESDAIRLANAAAGAVLVYENRSNSTNPEAEALLSAFHNASLELKRAEARLAAAEAESAGSDALAQAQAERSTAQVKLKGVSTAYVAAVASQAPSQGLVTLIAGATSASSDRKAKIELYAFLGLLAGLIVGCGAAVLRERRL